MVCPKTRFLFLSFLVTRAVSLQAVRGKAQRRGCQVLCKQHSTKAGNSDGAIGRRVLAQARLLLLAGVILEKFPALLREGEVSAPRGEGCSESQQDSDGQGWLTPVTR